MSVAVFHLHTFAQQKQEDYSWPAYDANPLREEETGGAGENDEITTPNGKKITVKQMIQIVGDAIWQHLKQWDVVGKLLKGQWTKENGLQLCTQLLDLGYKVPATLFWFGIIPPIPGKIWSYAFTALSMYGFLHPDGQVHAWLKKYVYPSTFESAEGKMRKRLSQWTHLIYSLDSKGA